MYFNIVFNFIYNMYLIKCCIFISQHLGLLRCGDATVIYALKERMKSDEEQRVRYEAAKSLILVGTYL